MSQTPPALLLAAAIALATHVSYGLALLLVAAAGALALRAQRRQTARDRAALLGIRLPVLLLDGLAAGTIADASPEMDDIARLPLGGLRGRSYAEFVHPDDREATAAVLAALRPGQYLADFRNRWLLPDGQIVHIEWHQLTADSRVWKARDVTADTERVARLGRRLDDAEDRADALARALRTTARTDDSLRRLDDLTGRTPDAPPPSPPAPGS